MIHPSLIIRSRNTIPTSTVTGNMTFGSGLGINFDAFGIKITDTYIQFGNDTDALETKLKRVSAAALGIRNAADDTYADLYLRNLYISTGSLQLQGTSYFSTAGSDGVYSAFKAQDTGVGLVEIARMQSAVDPHFRVGRDDTGVALDAVTDMLVLQAGGGAGNEAANFGLGTSWMLGNAASEVEKRGSINLVLTTATNGAEAVQFRFNAQIAGAAPSLVFSCGATGIGFNGVAATAKASHIDNTAGDDATAVNAILVVLENLGLVATA